MLSIGSRTVAAAVSAAALAAFPCAAGAAPFRASSVMAPTTTGTRLGLSLQMYRGRISSATEATALARSHRTISLLPWQLGSYGAAMHAANPGLRIYVYLNGMYAQRGQGAQFPAAWYMRDSSGRKIQSRGWGNYLMDPRAQAVYREGGQTYPSWRSYVAARCKEAIARSAGQFDGCFLDMLGSAPLAPSYNVDGGVPVDGSTGTPFTASRWFSTVSGPVAALAERVSGKPVLGNGIGDGSRYYGTSAGPSRTLFRFETAGDAEVWLRTAIQPIGRFPSDAQWRQDVQMLSDASASGHSVNATVKTWTPSTRAQRGRWRRFAYASYLIGNTGYATFEFSASTSPASAADDSPLYHLAIGTPSQTAASVRSYLSHGVYQRGFRHGRVLVNTGTSAVTVRLGGTFRTPRGRRVTRVTVPAHDATILVRA